MLYDPCILNDLLDYLLDRRAAMIRELYKVGAELAETGANDELLIEVNQTLLMLESLDE